jgi:tRNA 2-thiouridine synthesizing protein A
MRAVQRTVTGAGGGTIARVLELEGLPSTVAVAWAGVTMPQLRPGELLVVRSTDPDSVRDFGVWCRATGNQLVEWTEQRGTHRFVFVIRRRQGPEGWAPTR